MTSFQVSQWLRAGIAAAKSGDAERARELLLQVVDADEHNEQAWVWLSSVVESDEDRQICLENVLAINPHNNLAKAGLVHLRSRKAPEPPPLELTPEPPPSQPAAEPPPPAGMRAMPTDWWEQPPVSEPAPADGELLEDRLAAAAAPSLEEAPKAPEREKPKPKRRRRRVRLPVRRLVAAAFLVLGLLAAGVAVMAVLQRGPFSPTGSDYADAMRPLLADYEAWWYGPYGALVNELTSPCGPGADGWHNQDVLLVCSHYPAVDCALLAVHCGDDIDAMRELVDELSQETQQTGAALLVAFEAISPPDDVALAHARFLACLRARVADAGWTGVLARGESTAGPEHLPACQMFPNAEDEVRQYVGGW
jgi:hypothetical protein